MTLTEQWDKGELPEGDYYIKRRNGDTLYDNIDSHGVWRNSIDEDIVEVLAEVPSYEEWKSSDKLILTLMSNIKDKSDLLQQAMVKNAELKERNDSLNNRDKNLCRIANGIRDENFALKELLKECKRQFEEVELYRCDVADTDQEDWFKISTNQANVANKMIVKIDQVLGEE